MVEVFRRANVAQSRSDIPQRGGYCSHGRLQIGFNQSVNNRTQEEDDEVEHEKSQHIGNDMFGNSPSVEPNRDYGIGVE